MVVGDRDRPGLAPRLAVPSSPPARPPASPRLGGARPDTPKELSVALTMERAHFEPPAEPPGPPPGGLRPRQRTLVLAAMCGYTFSSSIMSTHEQRTSAMTT